MPLPPCPRVLNPGTTHHTPHPMPVDSPGCYGGPWSLAAFDPRGLWWTHPGCVCTLWGRGKAEVFIQGTLLRLCYRRNPPEGHDPNPVPPPENQTGAGSHIIGLCSVAHVGHSGSGLCHPAIHSLYTFSGIQWNPRLLCPRGHSWLLTLVN